MGSRRSACLFLFLSLFVLVVFGPSERGASSAAPADSRSTSYRPEADFFSVEIPPSFAKEAAVILLREDIIEIKNRKKAVWKQRIIKKLLKSKMQEKMFLFQGRYHSKIKKIDAKILKPDGEIIKLDRKRIMEVTGYDPGSMYSDVKSQRFAFEEARAGDIIDVLVIKEVTNVLFCDHAFFQEDLPVLKRRFHVQAPDWMKIEFKSVNFAKPMVPRILEERGRITYVFEQDSIPAFVSEIRAARVLESTPTVFLFFRMEHELGCKLDLSSWNGVAKWYRTLAAKSRIPGSKVRAIIEDLGLRKLPEKEAVRKAYDFVRKNIRYVSIQLGIGGYKPHRAEDVAECRYGDCKDKATLLNSILDELGINANYVLVRTLPSYPVPEDEPTMIFSHVISVVELDGRRQFLDPTCSDCIYGELPRMDEGAFALIVGKDSGEPVKLPRSEPSYNWLIDSLFIDLDEEGKASFKHKRIVRGLYRRLHGNLLASIKEKDEKELVETSFYDSGFDISIDRVSVNPAHAENAADSIVIQVTGRITGVTKHDDYFIINPHIVSIIEMKADFNASRNYPYYLGIPRTRMKSVEVTYPETWKLVGAMDDIEMKMDEIEYTSQTNSQKGRITFDSRILNPSIEILPEKYPEFYDAYQKMISNEKKEIVFAHAKE